MDDKIEPERIAQTPQWWTNWKQLRPHGSAVTSQILDAEDQTNPKFTENIEFVGTRIKPPQNLV